MKIDDLVILQIADKFQDFTVCPSTLRDIFQDYRETKIGQSALGTYFFSKERIEGVNVVLWQSSFEVNFDLIQSFSYARIETWFT